MKVGLGLGKCVNVARGEDSLSSACKNYKGLKFFVGWTVDFNAGRFGQKMAPWFWERARLVLVSTRSGVDKRWHPGFGREQDWC